MVIRNACAEELDEVVRVLRLAYREHRPSPMPTDLTEKWQRYWQDIADVRGRLPCTDLIVAELAGRIVGTVTLYLDGTRLERHGWPAGWAGIRLLGIIPEARRQGIGRALTEECVRRTRRYGASAIGLHTDESMRAARALYAGMGFQRAPEYDYHPVPDLAVLAYRLALAG